MNYAAITAKLKAMRSQLLSKTEYETLCNMKDTASLINCLKEKYAYQDMSNDLYRGLINAYNKDYLRISRYIYERPLIHFLKSVKGPTRDLSFYIKTWRLINRLDKKNKLPMLRIFGTEIDLLNIYLIYRLKTYYQVPNNSIYGYLLPMGYRLNPKSVTNMITCENEKTLLNEVQLGPYKGVFIDFLNPEPATSRATLKQYQRESLNYPHSLVPICCYLFEKETEIKNIQGIAAGITLGAKQNVIMNNLLQI